MSHMPRKARARSSTGIYHCILRGVDKRDIFLDDQDRFKFINELKDAKEKYGYELYAYCLMDNHVHMLIKENKVDISKIMHNVVLRYSIYFNLKYERVGHLFQNRYVSKPVETERYLLTVQRYIHQNPPYMETYKWSSYKEYVTNRREIVDTKFILELFAKDKQMAINEFRTFTCKKIEKISVADFKDSELVRNIPDKEVIKLIGESLNLKNILEIKQYNTNIRNEFLKEIMEIEGITVCQLSRIMEIDKKTLLKIKNEKRRPVPNGGKSHHWETSPKEVQNG